MWPVLTSVTICPYRGIFGIKRRVPVYMHASTMMESAKMSGLLPLLKILAVFWITFCVVPTSADAYPMERNGDVAQSGLHTALAVVLGVGSLFALVYALFNCSCCDESSLLKYEETPEENEVVHQEEDDFSPPTESTPSQKQPSVRTEEATPELVTATGNIDSGALKTFDDPKLQFPRDQLNYVDEIGSGWFGKALHAEAHQLHPGMRKTRVIVKQLRDSAVSDEQVLFMKEVQQYREVNHPNVMMLLGQCLETSPLLIIMEYSPNGDLKAYLKKNKGLTQSFAQDDVQLKMASDLASGLLWLHQADFVHIDFAARNCQVCADDVVKIGDYGIALEKYPDDYCMTKDGLHAVPVRWLAPEVIDASKENIEPKKITKQSNVWSFGVIMLELSTGGETPYPKLTNEEVIQKIIREKQIQLDKPNLAMKYADRWFEIMMFCWLDADKRTTTKELNDLLQHLKGYKEQLNKEDFESRWNALKPAAAQDESSESSIDVPTPPMKPDPTGENDFEPNFVEPEISSSPEQEQMQERPADPFEDISAPPEEQGGVSETTKKGNPFLKDVAEEFDQSGGKSDSPGPYQTSTPMESPAVNGQDRTQPSDTSGSYVTATGSLLDIGDKSESDSETFNTIVESMMDESLIAFGLEDGAGDDKTISDTDLIGDIDLNQNTDNDKDTYHSEAGIDIAGMKADGGEEDEEVKDEKVGNDGDGEKEADDLPTFQINIEVPKEEEKPVEPEPEPVEESSKVQANGQEANAANGHTTNGHAANGHTANGHVANGHAANGHAADTEAVEDDEDNKDRKRGKLEFSVIYNDKKEDLQCLVHRAFNLKAMDPNGYSDPYVKLHLLPRASSRDRSTKQRTKTKFKTLNPEFEEVLQYHGITKADLQQKTLRLSVWDEDSLGHNDFIGEYLLPLIKLPMNETIFYEKYLQGQSEEDELSAGDRGKILVGLQYFKQQNQINVVITRCVGLAAMDSNGYSDPYVKLYLQPDPHKKTKKKTATKKRTLNPEYNEKFLYKIPASDIHSKTLEISVWDKDVGTNDYIGGIQMGSTARGERRQHWVDAIENPSQLIERWHLLSEAKLTDED